MPTQTPQEIPNANTNSSGDSRCRTLPPRNPITASLIIITSNARFAGGILIHRVFNYTRVLNSWALGTEETSTYGGR